MAYRRAKGPKFKVTEQHQMEVSVVDQVVSARLATLCATTSTSTTSHAAVDGRISSSGRAQRVKARLQGAVLSFETRESDYGRFVGLIDLAIENASKAIEEARQRRD